MIKKITAYFENLSERQRNILLHLTKVETLQNENIWANVFHDSIRGKLYLQNLSLNIGRWAGNYTFFYILNRIMNDYKPKSIIEFGLGESSKFISTYLSHELPTSDHTIIEQDPIWEQHFKKSFSLNERSNVILCPLILKEVNGFQVNSYKEIESVVKEKYNLYIVDGPFGSERYSRFDIIFLAKKLTENDNFIIVFDDCDREGEKDTLKSMLDLFAQQNVPVEVGYYRGKKTVVVITSLHNKFYTSL